MNIDFVNFFNRTDRLNLDISNRCPLECPHCIRQTQYKNSNIDIPGEDLSLDSFKKITEFTNAIHFCGQLSDPIHHPMFIDFLKICFDKNIDTSIAVASSFKSLDWFVKAFKANQMQIGFLELTGCLKIVKFIENIKMAKNYIK